EEDRDVEAVDLLPLLGRARLGAARQRKERAGTREEAEPVQETSGRLARPHPLGRHGEDVDHADRQVRRSVVGPLRRALLPAREEILSGREVEYPRDRRARAHVVDLAEVQVLRLAVPAALAARHLRALDKVLGGLRSEE